VSAANDSPNVAERSSERRVTRMGEARQS
jgi:hypothetical protein